MGKTIRRDDKYLDDEYQEKAEEKKMKKKDTKIRKQRRNMKEATINEN